MRYCIQNGLAEMLKSDNYKVIGSYFKSLIFCIIIQQANL